ncbi:restriction endonuclease subunit S [Aggregatibacter aphrophilus]|uniref:restriction endonuclease subunit S n=1 Tax=Aggregatibacter aphrophilus TaxID=732 RepID=UPI00195270B0|nr:restriction endonuclease subunit S [Aggregatibacter aphrophilus]
MKLNDICKIGSSKRIHLSDYVENGVPFYRSKEIIELSEGNPVSEPLFISHEKFSEIKHKFPIPKTNDILITSVGTLGVVHLVKDPNFYFKDGNLTWLREFNENIIDIDFLFYWLNSNLFKKQILNNNIGAVQKAITIDFLKKVDISLPDIPNQKSIAAVLSTVDKKIALNKQINARLEEMAKTLYDYWFVQFDFPDANGKPYKSSGGEMVFDETLKREIPKGWEVKSLGEIENNIVTGKTPSTQYSNFFNGDIPFITIGDIRNNTFIIKTGQNLSIEGANNQKNKYLPEGSLCVSCIATVGLIGFTTRQAQTNQQINSIIFKHDYNKEFLYFYLKDYFLVGKAKTGNTFANMNKGDFEKILVLYPNLRLLQKYSNKMVLVLNQINNLSKQNHQLTQLRDFLLPMLMNGQVSVAE